MSRLEYTTPGQLYNKHVATKHATNDAVPTGGKTTWSGILSSRCSFDNCRSCQNKCHVSSTIVAVRKNVSCGVRACPEFATS